MNKAMLFMKKYAVRRMAVEMKLTTITKNLSLRGHRHDASTQSGMERGILIEYVDNPIDIWGIDPSSHPKPSNLSAALVDHAKYNDYRPEHHANGLKDMNINQLTEMICDIATSAEELSLTKETRDASISYMLMDRYDVREPLISIIINSVNELIERKDQKE